MVFPAYSDWVNTIKNGECKNCNVSKMLMGSWRLCFVGLLWCYFGLFLAEGLIEIVEEQSCHTKEFRLTCRDLGAHMAVLEAWYTPIDSYNAKLISIEDSANSDQISLPENDSELDKVYVYSSPNHNGYYQLLNHTIENQTLAINETIRNDTLSEKLVNEMSENPENELSGNPVNEYSVVTDSEVNDFSDCERLSFLRSYASWREKSKGRSFIPNKSSVNIRSPVTYRCTGVNHCSFILSQDYPAPNIGWLPGLVYIKYACFDDSLSVHYCNRELSIAASGSESEGYIRTPGYPHFYFGNDTCRWKLRVAEEQVIRITLMDVSLRSIGPFETECLDYILVKDSNGAILLSSSCQQVELPLLLTSSTSTVEIVVESRSKTPFPKRGVLLHYKSIGCVTLAAPPSSYLVYRNADIAHYMCEVNHIFVDTRQRARVIWCYEDNRWNDTVPSCVAESASDLAEEYSLLPGSRNDTKLTYGEPSMMSDIIIPSLLIVALFIGNAFIVLVIYKYRKRVHEGQEDEFNTIPLNGNGNLLNAGNAV